MITWNTLAERVLALYPDKRWRAYELHSWPGGPAGDERQCFWNALEIAEKVPGAEVLFGWQFIQWHAAVLTPGGVAYEVTFTRPLAIPLNGITVKPKLLRRWGFTATAAEAQESAEMHELAKDFESRCHTECVG